MSRPAPIYLSTVTVFGGLGPLGVDLLSDLGATKVFPAGLGVFRAKCRGGRPLAGSRGSRRRLRPRGLIGPAGRAEVPVVVFGLMALTDFAAIRFSKNRMA